jgi:sugar phosphate permease
MVYVGTLICALAQTFTLSTPPLIAGNWFGADERATSTSLGILANQLGTGLGLGAAVVVDFLDLETGELDRFRLHDYLHFQFHIACVALVSVVIFAGDKPPTPPSLAASLTRPGPETIELEQGDMANEDTSLLLVQKQNERSGDCTDKTSDFKAGGTPLSYMESILLVVSDFSSLVFALCFGLTVGVYYTVPTFLSQLMPPSWSPRSIGWLGVLYQLVGVIGSFCAGRIIDITKKHRAISIACLIGSFIALLVYYMTTMATLNGFDSSWLAAFAIGCAGVALSAYNTVGIELGTSMTFPADEAAIAGVLESAAELGGFLCVTIGGSMTDSTEMASKAATQIASLLTFCVAVSLVLLMSIRTELNRPL